MYRYHPSINVRNRLEKILAVSKYQNFSGLDRLSSLQTLPSRHFVIPQVLQEAKQQIFCNSKPSQRTLWYETDGIERTIQTIWETTSLNSR